MEFWEEMLEEAFGSCERNGCIECVILMLIKEILADDELDDRMCFYRIERIVRLFEGFGIDCGGRHDFG